MVGYIRADETAHVEYLRTALSELSARTLRRVDGGQLSGQRVVNAFLHRNLRALTGEQRAEQRSYIRAAVVDAVTAHANPSGLLERFDALEAPWTPPAQTGFEAGPAAEASGEAG